MIFLSFVLWSVRYKEFGTTIFIWFYWQKFMKSKNNCLLTYHNGWLVVENIGVDILADNWKWSMILIIMSLWTGWRRSVWIIWIFLILCSGFKTSNPALEYLLFRILVQWGSYDWNLCLLIPQDEHDLVWKLVVCRITMIQTMDMLVLG